MNRKTMYKKFGKLKRKKAEWFANRWKLDGKVYQGKVKKVDIFLYTDARAEKEVVVNPLCIKSLKEVKIDIGDGEADG